MKIQTDPQFEEAMSNYPSSVKGKMENLRQLVHDVAQSTSEIHHLHETVKWGEPSFKTKHGTTLRMDWKEKSPEQYALYVQCTTKLIDTFRLVYPNVFNYEGTRAIVFNVTDELPIHELKECMKATLLYHKKKNSELLGFQ